MLHKPQHLLNDPDRLRALAGAELLDTEAEPAFDRFTRAAALLTGSPTALISLVDEHRQFFKSTFGLEGRLAIERETPISHSFCQHVVGANKRFVVENSCEHPLVAENPSRIELDIQAYAGAPIHADGQPIGALCVLSPKPRNWTADDLEVLETLATAVNTEINLHTTRRELASRTALLSTLTESSHDAILSIDADGKIVFANAATASIFLYTAEELLQRSIEDLMPERYRGQHFVRLARMNAGGASKVLGSVVELIGLRQNQEEFPLECSLSRWTQRGKVFYTAIIRDITERSRLDRVLREKEEQLRLTVDQSPIGIALLAPDGRWLRVNDALCRIVGYSRDELLKLDFQAITHPEDLQADVKLVHELLSGAISSYQLEKRYIHKAGQTVWIMLAVSLVRSENGEPAFFVAQVQDISERHALEAQVRESSLQDELTGLRNRRGFLVLGDQALATALRYGRDMVLLFADLNGLKTVNDKLGHDAGDRMISAMAETLRTTFRRADIIARLGGDEFVLLAEGDEDFAAKAEAKLQQAIANFNAVSREPFPLSASIGSVCARRGSSSTLKELMAVADARMYAAKRRYKALGPGPVTKQIEKL